MSTEGPSLTLAVPVHNDGAAAAALLARAGLYEVFDRIVVVDDGSEPALDRRTLPDLLQIDLIRTDPGRGAGHARNRALDAVQTSHVLFFDADDRLTPEIVPLWQDLTGQTFDFCLFRHTDSRFSWQGEPQAMPEDAAYWRQAGCSIGTLQRPAPDVWPLLAQTANYPWNKIYRTEFLRVHDIRCSETRVHNDVALHWLSFLHARDMLVSDRCVAGHIVSERASRLTNESGRARLDVIGAVFVPLWEALRAQDGATGPMALAFLRFTTGLADWIAAQITRDLRAPFAGLYRDFLRDSVGALPCATLAALDAEAAARLARWGAPA